MTVRQRLLASAAAFLAAAALVGTARAQQPFGQDFPQRDITRGRPLPPDEVKARIEQFLSGAGEPGFQPNLPFGMTPKQFADLSQMLAPKDGQKQKIDPKQAEALRKWLDENPEVARELKQRMQKGERPPVDPGQAPRPVPPVPKVDDGKLPPFKVDGPGKRPPDVPPMPPVGPRPVPPQPRPPIQKEDVAPPDPRDNPLAPPRDPKDRRPWEMPESPQEKARQAAAAMWEKNVGPLDETPAVKKALFDLADGSFDLKDPDGNKLWETFGKEFGDGKGLGDLFDGFDGDGFKFGDNWDFPKLNWNLNFNWGNSSPPKLDPGNATPRESWWSRWRRSPSTPSSPSSGSSWFSGWKAPKWNIGVPAVDGTWLPVVFLVAALVGGFFLWRYLARRWVVPDNRIDPYALGPWPVDPFHLASRQDVVVAFEHLSVLICGEVAKTWTHTTIAGALSELAMAEPQRAMLLARLYELARYTPADEPLTTAELAEARRIVCTLAGFSDD